MKYPKNIVILDYFNTEKDQMLIKISKKYPYIRIYDYFTEKNSIRRFLSEGNFFDLVILLNNKFKIEVKDPLIFYNSEVKFSREFWSEDIFYKSLEFYDNVKITKGL